MDSNASYVELIARTANGSWGVLNLWGVKRSGDTITGEIVQFMTAPRISFKESDAAADNGWWDFFINSEAFNLRVVNDASTAATNVVTIQRTGTTVDSINLGAITQPNVDNTLNLGAASKRWKEVFAGTGTINTSDENEKELIEDLSTAETAVAIALKGLIKKFKFKDAVIEKGAGARIHVGVIAQDVRDAFTAEGLDAHDYGVFCSNTWWEREETRTPMIDNPDFDLEQPESEENPKKVEGDPYIETVIYTESVEGGVEKTRLGVRYDELFAFIIAGL